MTDYGRISVRGIYSVNSDYSEPRHDTKRFQYEITPDEAIHTRLEVPTADTTLSLANFTSVSSVVIHNTDATNFVTVDWTGSTEAPADNSNVQKIPADGLLVLSHVVPAGNLVFLADTGTVYVDVFVTGT